MALREVLRRMLTHEQTLRDLAGRMYALDTCYDMRIPEPHALTARCSQPPAPAALIRPDGYVAWAGAANGDDPGLRAALAAWFGVAA